MVREQTHTARASRCRDLQHGVRRFQRVKQENRAGARVLQRPIQLGIYRIAKALKQARPFSAQTIRAVRERRSRLE